ncbi:DUF222 domain-containing protein [uncultured Friedmanniella sp.]|uniref:HNH endonuclease signature motif containing protein n=1 Tax=uncultured Friedmanniella sp. TaxID=335381 RepID=UPI0035CA623F
MARGIQQCDDTDVCPVNRAERGLSMLNAGLDELIAAVDDGELGSFDDQELIGFLQRLEKHRNQMPVVDHAMLAEAESRRLADRLTQPNLVRVLVGALRLSSREAQSRVKAAEAVGPRTTMAGERLEPIRPVLAAAQRNGQVTPEQVQLIVRALSQVDRPGFDPAQVDAGETLLTGFAETFEPRELSRLADHVVERIDPDGTRPDDELVAERRHLSMRQVRNGSWIGEFRLTGVAGAKLAAVLRPLAKPRTEPVPCADGANRTAALLAASDGRTYGQRMHDALEDVCDRMLRSDTLPDVGGVPATVIVTISEEDLRERVGVGHTSDGARLSVAQVLDLAGQADVIPTVLSRAGAVKAQGRNRRIATAALTWALIARDGGCSFPACDRSPELCERHHIVPWIDGGLTDLDNLTLLCRYHHHQFEQRGWTAAINADGLPEWTPPKWMDPQRRPLLNARIRQRLLSQTLPPTLFRPTPVKGGRDPSGESDVGWAIDSSDDRDPHR